MREALFQFSKLFQRFALSQAYALEEIAQRSIFEGLALPWDNLERVVCHAT